MKDHQHFSGKSALEHLKEARKKGAQAIAEAHGVEMPGYFFAAIDASKETIIALLLLWVIAFPQSFSLFFVFACGWIVWKVGRSALLGWARLEKLHRLIEEERWEIEHEREQEREELTALYQDKGLEGKLLHDVISVLMADDNRLLQIMLEEEMGLSLEVYEHPLKQASGAALGVILSTALFYLSWLTSPTALIVMSSVIIMCAAAISAKKEKNRMLEAVIWNLSLAAFAVLSSYFLFQLVSL